MANSKLSDLVAIGTPLSTDLVPIQRGTGNLQSVLVSALGGGAGLAGWTTISPSGDTTGATDTAAIQAAITSGLNLLLAPGIFYTNATLNVVTYNSCGQTIRGSGSYYGSASVGFSTTPPPNTTVIRPTAAVSKAFLIDGTPVGGVATTFIQGFGIDNLCIDMTNMADLASSQAIQQVQAFDCHYTSIRVNNYGNLKESWNFQAGAYVSQLLNCQGGIIYFDGVTTSNATTTISIVNCDIQSIYHDHFQNITLQGGAVQRPYNATMVAVYIPPGKTPYALPTNTTGLYGWVMSEINTSLQFTSIGTDYEQAGGYPSTYNDGTHGVLTAIPVIMVDNNAINTTFINPTFAGMYLLDYGINTRVIGQGQSGVTGFDISTGVNYILNDFRVSGTLSGPVGFGGALGTETSSSYNIVGSTGLATFQGEFVKPAADGFVVTWRNAANNDALRYNSSANQINLSNGAALQGYHDNAVTPIWALTDISGNGKLVLYNGGAASITLDSNGNIVAGGIYNTPVGQGGGAANLGTFTALNATTSLGYSTGAGGTVTQGTSRTTTVILNKAVGAITLFSAAGQATYQSFTVTNSTVAATDTIILGQKSGTDKQILLVTAVAAGSFQITFATTGGTTVEQPVINFAVIKGVTS